MTTANEELLRLAREPSLDELLEWARTVTMTPEEREEQRRSFAYGNAAIENPRVTRELVDRVADEMAGKDGER